MKLLAEVLTLKFPYIVKEHVMTGSKIMEDTVSLIENILISIKGNIGTGHSIWVSVVVRVSYRRYWKVYLLVYNYI